MSPFAAPEDAGRGPSTGWFRHGQDRISSLRINYGTVALFIAFDEPYSLIMAPANTRQIEKATVGGELEICRMIVGLWQRAGNPADNSDMATAVSVMGKTCVTCGKI